ncbi:uncharacterized protein LOC126710318 [Quercus robur]|uniref:uncharacterized protein LOC126710318 n=1 Tax=Quercus robur TaxID=38942 RepID=UPI002163C819|nr:uncharacterized protein LOC126710318 [Quercus robur]
MSSSNEIQTIPEETSTHSQAKPPVQSITETSTNPHTTTSNISNNEVNHKKNNGDNSQKPAEQHTHESSNNEHSKCSWIWDLLPNKGTAKNQNQNGEGSTTSREKAVDWERMKSQCGKLNKKLEQVKAFVDQLEKFATTESFKDIKNHVVRLQDTVKNISEYSEKMDASSSTKTPAVILPEINKDITKLMKHLSSPETVSEKVSWSAHLQSSTESNGRSAVDELVNVHNSASFSKGSFYIEIQDIFNGLDDQKKFFLSCFTVFPENAVVKRRIFVYWGVGEDLLVAKAEYPEKIVDEILEEFQKKGLIEPAIKKRKQPGHVKSYRMDPLVRSAVILLSKEAKFFDYDIKGNVLPQRDWTLGLDSKGHPLVDENVSFQRSQRLCLQNVLEPDERKPSTGKENKRTVSEQDLENAVTLFNVNEPFPDLELAWLTKMKDINVVQTKEPTAVDWLSKMKNAKVVCLGSWPGSAKSHIEVESIEFLKGLTSNKKLRFLSLQGISRITELPDFIGRQSNLVILDLKECHNLELLSKKIAELINLRYLDLSDCYLLARMPKGLGKLLELQVLKGFVISNPQTRSSGTLDDLKRLEKLRKLTINASSEEFPTNKDLLALQELASKALRKLTIAWGAALADQQKKGSEPANEQEKPAKPEDQNGRPAKPADDQQGNEAKSEDQNGRPAKPADDQQVKEAESEDQNGREASCWKRIIPAPNQQKLEKRNDQPKLPMQLEKLDLQCFPKSTAPWLTHDFFPILEKLYIRGGNLATLDKSEWSNVKTLRLKYLRELKMNWRELQKSFPKLEYLEKVKCPGITLCPCDQHGVWMMNPDQIEQKQL